MRTTVDIPEKLLREAMRHTKAKTKRDAILVALEALNRRYAMAELVQFSGTAKDLISIEELARLRANAMPVKRRPASRQVDGSLGRA